MHGAAVSITITVCQSHKISGYKALQLPKLPTMMTVPPADVIVVIALKPEEPGIRRKRA